VGQEFFINSQALEDKVSALLPSQGGRGAGFDLSASTQIIPIIDLTESAEGANVRQDLQTAFSFNSVTSFSVTNATTNIIVNTGYFRVFGSFNNRSSTSADFSTQKFVLTDGATSKDLLRFRNFATSQPVTRQTPFDFIVFLSAGDILQVIVENTGSLTFMEGVTRQIATIDGTLVDPT